MARVRTLATFVVWVVAGCGDTDRIAEVDAQTVIVPACAAPFEFGLGVHAVSVDITTPRGEVATTCSGGYPYALQYGVFDYTVLDGPKSLRVTIPIDEKNSWPVFMTAQRTCGDASSELACGYHTLPPSGPSSWSLEIRDVATGPVSIVVGIPLELATGTLELAVNVYPPTHGECNLYTRCITGLDCHPSSPSGPYLCLEPACRDGYDNDGDGMTDYPADPECANADDNGE